MLNRLKKILKHIKNNDMFYFWFLPMIIILLIWQVSLMLHFMGYIG